MGTQTFKQRNVLSPLLFFIFKGKCLRDVEAGLTLKVGFPILYFILFDRISSCNMEYD